MVRFHGRTVGVRICCEHCLNSEILSYSRNPQASSRSAENGPRENGPRGLQRPNFLRYIEILTMDVVTSKGWVKRLAPRVVYPRQGPWGRAQRG
jgi:hypothetical protein